MPELPASEPVSRSGMAGALAVGHQARSACVQCGETVCLTAHDVIAREDGGPDDPSNLEALCRVCHGRVTGSETARTSRQLADYGDVWTLVVGRFARHDDVRRFT